MVNEAIKDYQKEKYTNDPNYREKVLAKNKRNYYNKYRDNEEYKEKMKINNRLYYEKTKEMKAKLLLLEQSLAQS